MIRPFLLGLALVAASAATAPMPPPIPTAILGWDDDPPAIEVRPLSGFRTVRVRYGALLPAAFVAELDGERVTALFHPVPHTVETVELPFIGGRNRLLIAASNPDGLVHITLERIVVFARLPEDSDAGEGARLHSAPELKHELWKQQTPEVPPQPAAPPAAVPATVPPKA